MPNPPACLRIRLGLVALAAVLLLMSAGLPALAQDDAPADIFQPPDWREAEVPPTRFSRMLPNDPPRALRRVEGGVELYVPETDSALRRYLPGQGITTWVHVGGDRWWVAHLGGTVVQVDFDAQSVERVLQFDGNVYWLKIERREMGASVHLAIAEHQIRGVGTVRLLYIKDPVTRELRVEMMDSAFSRVYEDPFGRAWLLPRQGDELTELTYLSAGTGERTTIPVPKTSDRLTREFGGMLSLPDGPTLIWGFDLGNPDALISWVAELTPPVFDDAVWQEVESFAATGLPLFDGNAIARPGQLRRGRGFVTLTYDPVFEMFELSSSRSDHGWVGRGDLDYWVHENNMLGLHLGDPAALDRDPQSTSLRFDPDPVLADGWADAYMDRLLDDPIQRVAHIDPEVPTDPLLDAMLRDVDWQGRGIDAEIHIAAGCDEDWVLGLDTGVIVRMDPATGRFAEMAEVNGLPTRINLREQRGETKLFVEYWPAIEEEPHRATFVLGRRGRWTLDSNVAIKDQHPYIWTDRRTAQLRHLGRDHSYVEWRDLASQRTILPLELRSDLELVGLLDMPDGRVVAYGTDRQNGNDAPILIDAVRGRKGVVWHRDYGFYAHNAPMPTEGITHAVYVHEARRVLILAGETVFSTDRWFSDWRVERIIGAERDGAADEVDAADDEDPAGIERDAE